MKDAGKARLRRGIAELAGGAICLLIVVIMFAANPTVIVLPRLFVLGFLVLTGNGIVDIMKGRQIARFR